MRVRSSLTYVGEVADQPDCQYDIEPCEPEGILTRPKPVEFTDSIIGLLEPLPISKL